MTIIYEITTIINEINKYFTVQYGVGDTLTTGKMEYNSCWKALGWG